MKKEKVPVATTLSRVSRMTIWTTDSFRPSFLGVASQNRSPWAGRRNSMELELVTQVPPREQAQVPPTVSARVAMAPPWIMPWGLMELGPAWRTPRARPGSTWVS